MWEERKVLIAEELAKGHHDVVTLQEVLERLKFLVILSHCAGPVVWRVENAIHRINLYLVDSAVRLLDTYPLDSDISVR